MTAKLKVFLSGFLLLFSSYAAYRGGEKWQYIACAAFGFSWLGDALLAHYPPITGKLRDPFIPGMGAFALAQIMFIRAFRQSMLVMPSRHARIPGDFFGAEVLPGLLLVYLLIALLFWVVIVLRSGEPLSLRLATLVYALLVCAMAAYATAAAFTGKVFVWPLLYGGLLFIVSDGAIALRIFQSRFTDEKMYDAFVWATYLPAQLLLLLGISWLQ